MLANNQFNYLPGAFVQQQNETNQVRRQLTDHYQNFQQQYQQPNFEQQQTYNPPVSFNEYSQPLQQPMVISNFLFCKNFQIRKL